MKKIVCLVIGLILMMSVAYAEGDITFQGVPWLSDEATTLQILSDKGLLRDGFTHPVFSGESGNYIIEEETLGYCPTKNDIYKEVNYSINLAGKTKGKIAGCTVKDIILTFANNKVSSRLICVKVILNGESFSGLRNKLTKVYGEGLDRKEDEFETIIWTGENESAIILFTEDDGYSYQLVYGRLDSEIILQDALGNHSDQVDPDDISGL